MLSISGEVRQAFNTPPSGPRCIEEPTTVDMKESNTVDLKQNDDRTNEIEFDSQIGTIFDDKDMSVYSDLAEQYAEYSFFIHPDARLVKGMPQRGGGRGLVFVGKKSPALGTVILEETAFVLASDYNGLLEKISQSPVMECPIIKSMHPVFIDPTSTDSSNCKKDPTTASSSTRKESTGERKDGGSKSMSLVARAGLKRQLKSRLKEVIAHNWHSADDLLVEGEFKKAHLRAENSEVAKELRSQSRELHDVATTRLLKGQKPMMTANCMDVSGSGTSEKAVPRIGNSDKRPANMKRSPQNFVGLWPMSSLINHDFYQPNVSRSFCVKKIEKSISVSGSEPTENSNSYFYALVSQYRVIKQDGILYGEEILDNYLDLTATLEKRNEMEYKQHRIPITKKKGDAYDRYDTALGITSKKIAQEMEYISHLPDSARLPDGSEAYPELYKLQTDKSITNDGRLRDGNEEKLLLDPSEGTHIRLMMADRLESRSSAEAQQRAPAALCPAGGVSPSHAPLFLNLAKKFYYHGKTPKGDCHFASTFTAFLTSCQKGLHSREAYSIWSCLFLHWITRQWKSQFMEAIEGVVGPIVTATESEDGVTPTESEDGAIFDGVSDLGDRRNAKLRAISIRQMKDVVASSNLMPPDSQHGRDLLARLETLEVQIKEAKLHYDIVFGPGFFEETNYPMLA